MGKEEIKIRNFLVSFTSLILLAAALTALMAVCCDFFDVYIPGVSCLIPTHIQKSHYQEAQKSTEPVYTREEVIIIKNPTGSP